MTLGPYNKDTQNNFKVVKNINMNIGEILYL